MAIEKTFGERWRVIAVLGKGGQGVVYKVGDTNGFPSQQELDKTIKEGLRKASEQMIQMYPEPHSFDQLMQGIRDVVNIQNPPLAAAKELLPFEDAVASDEKTALARMKNEIETLASVNHPSLLKVFESRLEQRWFVMEYFRNGPMSKQPNRFQGKVLESLRALRPIVDAVNELHKKKIVHRDIKPENVFIADDGHLVLGDCGLAIKVENQDRLTLSFENVGTRDYQPPWTYGMRVEDVKPNFDVFSLGKLLWAMVSGRPRFPLWYFDWEPHDLTKIFPTSLDVLFINRILKKSVVEREAECTLADASALLREIDETLQALEAGGQVPNKTRRMRCRFCGLGSLRNVTGYQAIQDSTVAQNNAFWVCDNCGHLEIFSYIDRQVPLAWRDE